MPVLKDDTRISINLPVMSFLCLLSCMDVIGLSQSLGESGQSECLGILPDLKQWCPFVRT